MTGASPPTARYARTGLFTPRGKSSSARLRQVSLLSLPNCALARGGLSAKVAVPQPIHVLVGGFVHERTNAPAIGFGFRAAGPWGHCQQTVDVEQGPVERFAHALVESGGRGDICYRARRRVPQFVPRSRQRDRDRGT